MKNKNKQQNISQARLFLLFSIIFSVCGIFYYVVFKKEEVDLILPKDPLILFQENKKIVGAARDNKIITSTTTNKIKPTKGTSGLVLVNQEGRISDVYEGSVILTGEYRKISLKNDEMFGGSVLFVGDTTTFGVLPGFFGPREALFGFSGTTSEFLDIDSAMFKDKNSWCTLGWAKIKIKNYHDFKIEGDGFSTAELVEVIENKPYTSSEIVCQ